MICTGFGSLLRPLFYFLCSNLKANPVNTLSWKWARFYLDPIIGSFCRSRPTSDIDLRFVSYISGVRTPPGGHVHIPCTEDVYSKIYLLLVLPSVDSWIDEMCKQIPVPPEKYILLKSDSRINWHGWGQGKILDWTKDKQVQGGWGGWPTGNGKKLSSCQAQLGQATCLAVA